MTMTRQFPAFRTLAWFSVGLLLSELQTFLKVDCILAILGSGSVSNIPGRLCRAEASNIFVYKHIHIGISTRQRILGHEVNAHSSSHKTRLVSASSLERHVSLTKKWWFGLRRTSTSQHPTSRGASMVCSALAVITVVGCQYWSRHKLSLSFHSCRFGRCTGAK